MSTTRLLRWREIEPTNAGADKMHVAGDTGDPDLDGLIRVARYGTLRDGTGGWNVECRESRLSADSWLWAVMYLDRPQLMASDNTLDHIGSEKEAKATVAENWEELERYAREMLERATASPVAAEDAVEAQRDALAAEALGLSQGVDMLSTVAAVEPPLTEARDARVSQGVLAALHERYFVEVSQIVGRMREVADRIEKREVRQSLADLRLDYTAHAGEVMDDLRWMLGNTRLGPLARAARDADLAVRGKMP